MPKYRKRGGKNPLRKRFKLLSHKDAASIHTSLSNNQFRALQELAIHALGYPTNYSANLPERPSKKVRPSSFKIYAGAETPAEVVKTLAREKAAHDDHTSETHMGGGLLDAINTIGTYAYSLLGNIPTGQDSFDWAFNKLDGTNIATETGGKIDNVFQAAKDERKTDQETQQDGGLVQTVDHAVDQAMLQAENIVKEEAENIATQAEEAAQTVAQTAVDQVKEHAVDWIGDILSGLL